MFDLRHILEKYIRWDFIWVWHLIDTKSFHFNIVYNASLDSNFRMLLCIITTSYFDHQLFRCWKIFFEIFIKELNYLYSSLALNL